MSDILHCVVYVISCKITGKRYVGITKNTLAERYAGHLYSAKKGSKKVLYDAIRKYGEHNFTCSEICTALTWQHACYIERLLIFDFNCKVPNGYNMTDGGEGTVGWSAPAELREVWSKQRKGRGWTEEQNAARALKVKEQWADPEFRQARQESMSNRKWTDEQRARKSEVMKGMVGRKQTEESKSKISASHKARLARQLAEKEQIEWQM